MRLARAFFALNASPLPSLILPTVLAIACVPDARAREGEKPRAYDPPPLAFADRAAVPKSIAVAAGVPIVMRSNGTTDNGGFGDVAANIHMARAFKRAYPGMEVHLIVSLVKPISAAENSVEKIVRTMLPTLDLRREKTPQTIDGLVVHVLSDETYRALRSSMPGYGGVDFLPACDLSVQYAANGRGQEAILRATGKRYLRFYEYEGRSRLLNATTRNFATGLRSNGVYDLLPAESADAAKIRISEWLRETTGAGLGEAKYGYAYTAYAFSTQAYLDAMFWEAKARPEQEFVVFYKAFDGLKIPRRANLRAVPLTSFSETIGNALPVGADLPPLVTGDSSFASALLSVRKDRAFAYEVVPWKSEMIVVGREWWSAVSPDKDLFFVRPLGAGTLLSATDSLLKLFGDRTLAKRLYETVQRTKDGLSLVRNTVRLAAFVDAFGAELDAWAGTPAGFWLEAFGKAWVKADDETDFAAKISAEIAAADYFEGVAWGAAMKLFAGHALTDAEQAKWFAYWEAQWEDRSRWTSAANTITAYGVWLGKNPAFGRLLAAAKTPGTAAAGHRELLEAIWSQMEGRVDGLPSFDEAAALGCGDLSKRRR